MAGARNDDMMLRANIGAAAWLIRTPDRPHPEHLAVLTPEERNRCDRFRDAERQARFAAGRALLRQLLGAQLDLAPAEVPIVIGDKRRPQLAARRGDEADRLDFNLSSTPGFVACALARGARVGIDIEHPGRVLDMESLAENIFTERERRWWSASSDRDRARNFCRLWALKESVAKADGEGLGLPFGELTLLPGDDGKLEVDLDAMGEDARRWRVLECDTALPTALALRWSGRETGPVALSPAWPAGITFDTVPLKPGSTTP